MSRITRVAAACASVAALGAASAAPATAQEIDPQVNIAICGGHITVPCLVDTTFNVADAAVAIAEAAVKDTLEDVNTVVYRVCDIVTGDCNP